VLAPAVAGPAIQIEWRCSSPKNHTVFFMTGFSPPVTLNCNSCLNHSLTHDQRVGAGHPMMTSRVRRLLVGWIVTVSLLTKRKDVLNVTDSRIWCRL
jgi:hypothetical protein